MHQNPLIYNHFLSNDSTKKETKNLKRWVNNLVLISLPTRRTIPKRAKEVTVALILETLNGSKSD